MRQRKPLKNLGAWIGSGAHSFADSLLDTPNAAPPSIQTLEIQQLTAGRYQPRQQIDADYLAELAQSIQQLGIIEPLVVRPLADGIYEILAGHMRWQAAQQAGLTHVPVVVRNADDRTAAAIALVENLLRRALNPIEEGRALYRLREEFQLTQAQLAELLSISQTAISRALGLLTLDTLVQAHIEGGRLNAGHGKVLLGLFPEQQCYLAEQALNHGWSVRELEQQRSALLNPAPRPSRTVAMPDPNVLELEERLREHLAAPVRLHYDSERGRGRIEIKFTNLDECDGILQRLGMDKRST